MTSRLGQRATSIAAAAAIVCLAALLVLLWTVAVARQRPARPPPLRSTAPPTRDASDLDIPEGVANSSQRPWEPRLPNESLPKDKRVEFVTPMKVPAPPLHKDDLRYGADDWSSGHGPVHPGSPPAVDTGHFRPRQALLWDPHPQYTFCAFGQLFHLQLAQDSSFVAPNLRVTRLWHNYTQQDAAPPRSANCFYTGHVHGEPSSSVAVSLCHGMTGHIRTSTANYFIEPVVNGTKLNGSMVHKMYVVPTPQMESEDSSTSHHCGYVGSGGRRPKRQAGEYDSAQLRRGSRYFGPAPLRRTKRPKQEYFVEVMVVADEKMARYHGEGLNDYILTLMSIVAKLYKDPSIGNPISVAVVKLVVLNSPLPYKRHRNDMLGTSATEMMHEFCNWQRSMNVRDDASPKHHDTALLLTRENICRNPQEQTCETLGLAELGTICDMNASCSIVQDNGLSAAFTIAHEFGHVLNMPHDDAEECKAFGNTSLSQNVMSRMLDSATSPWSWSNCSRHSLTEFLEGGHGSCLMDSPSRDFITDVPHLQLPGENFKADRQCELLFSEGYRLCSYMPVCKQLWCTVGRGENEEGCRTKHMPWADGTYCARGKWCQRGVCVPSDRNALTPVNGGWGGWKKYGECSRPCGGGVKRSIRECNSPSPANGGRYCIGRRMRFQSCNTEECPRESQDFREKQCAAFNNNTFDFIGLAKDVQWVPKYGTRPEERCQLYCRVKNSQAYYRLGEKVIDGTPCGPDTFDICVNGACKQAGCDHKLGSPARLDVCGVCNGGNTSCELVTGAFNKTIYGYNHVVRIPIGSINIDVQQTGYQGLSNDHNYLALMDDSGEYILNGGYVLTTFHKIISLNGNKLEYTGINTPIERLNATKPLKKDIIIQILSVGKLYPPDISYRYTVRCQWKHWEWSKCNKQCEGASHRKPYCSLLDRNEEIPEHFCSKMPKPETYSQPCTCRIRWQTTAASECSVRCGTGYRNLTAHCMQESTRRQEKRVDNSLCLRILGSPPSDEKCEVACESRWKYGDWGSCSKSCGGGYQDRLAECVNKMEEPVNESLCDTQELTTRQKCGDQRCPSWELGDWTPCSVSCGLGERHRPYWCNQENRVVAPVYCPQLAPRHRENCSLACSVGWHHM